MQYLNTQCTTKYKCMFIYYLSIIYLTNTQIQNVSLFREILASEICNSASCKVSASAGKTIEGNLAATKFIIVQCQAGMLRRFMAISSNY